MRVITYCFYVYGKNKFCNQVTNFVIFPLTIPYDLIDALIKVTGAKNKTQAVIRAIKDEIKHQKQENIRKKAGTFEFIEEPEDIRHGNHRLG